MPPKVNRAVCVGCGICLFQCGRSVFAFDAEASKSLVRRPRDCVDCFICEKYCPVQAIKVRAGRPK